MVWGNKEEKDRKKGCGKRGFFGEGKRGVKGGRVRLEG